MRPGCSTWSRAAYCRGEPHSRSEALWPKRPGREPGVSPDSLGLLMRSPGAQVHRDEWAPAPRNSSRVAAHVESRLSPWKAVRPERDGRDAQRGEIFRGYSTKTIEEATPILLGQPANYPGHLTEVLVKRFRELSTVTAVSIRSWKKAHARRPLGSCAPARR
jgi:hypothetical protein